MQHAILIYIKVVAKALIVNSLDELLLLYRGNTHPNFPGHLDLPGGEVEEDEQWTDAVAREIREETGIKVLSSELLKVFETQYPEVTHVFYIAQLKGHHPDIDLSWEHVAYKWLVRSELLQIPLPTNVDRYYSDVINYLEKTTKT